MRAIPEGARIDPQESFKLIAKKRKRSFAGDAMWRGRLPSMQPRLTSKRTTPPTQRMPPFDELGAGLKRVFGIDVSTCVHCGGAVRIVAGIEEPNAIRAILAHFEKHGALD